VRCSEELCRSSIGVNGDSGNPDKRRRDEGSQFVQVDRDNFDQVLAGMRPRLAYRVDDKLSARKPQLNVERASEHGRLLTGERRHRSGARQVSRLATS